MKRLTIFALMMLCLAGCNRRAPQTSGAQATFLGTTLVESSGGKQVASVGATLEQPLVVQMNDAQGAAVAGALVRWRGPAGVKFEPATGVTDSSGQFSSLVTLGAGAGRYHLVAASSVANGKNAEVTLEEIALGYQEQLGRQVSDKYCVRCHDPESTPERVSNMDNLDPKPHAFSEGDALNRFSDADLNSIITHGGAALNKSAQMPPYGYTLSKNEIQAVIAYIRAIQDPSFQTKGVIYAQK